MRDATKEWWTMMGYSTRTFEAVAVVEGLSFLVLLAVAMPLKYLAGVALATRVVGLIHGLAFLAYAVVAIDAFATRRWSGRTFALGLLAGFLPAGTFLFVSRLRRLDPARAARPSRGEPGTA
jgi:integral membrane protein